MQSRKPRRATGVIVALSLATVGVLAAATSAVALATGAVGAGDEPAAPLAADAASSSAVPSEVEALPEVEPVEAPAPAAAAAATASELRVYGVADSAADVTYPASFAGDELANAHVWIEQQFLIATCMDDQGFEYAFAPYWERAVGLGSSPEFTAEPGSPEWLALWGENSGAEYDWRDAGCDGYAVHVTGMDNAN